MKGLNLYKSLYEALLSPSRPSLPPPGLARAVHYSTYVHIDPMLNRAMGCWGGGGGGGGQGGFYANLGKQDSFYLS